MHGFSSSDLAFDPTTTSIVSKRNISNPNHPHSHKCCDLYDGLPCINSLRQLDILFETLFVYQASVMDCGSDLPIDFNNVCVLFSRNNEIRSDLITFQQYLFSANRSKTNLFLHKNQTYLICIFNLICNIQVIIHSFS